MSTRLSHSLKIYLKIVVRFFLITYFHGLNICVPHPNSNVESSSLMRQYLEVGSLVMRVDLLLMGAVSLYEDKNTRILHFSTM